jgi:SAM-dependent methyltransferase
VEVSPHARDILSRRGGRALPPDDLASLPEGGFAAVLAFEVLEHIEDDERVVAEVARLLRPGGHLVLSVPIRQSRWTTLDDVCGHVRRYEPQDLAALLSRHGLQVVGVRSTFGPPRGLAGLRARMMRDHPEGSTSVVQGFLFPMHARMQRLFAAPRWRPPDATITPRAEGILVWARKPEGAS